jgi:hypothetical protein
MKVALTKAWGLGLVSLLIAALTILVCAQRNSTPPNAAPLVLTGAIRSHPLAECKRAHRSFWARSCAQPAIALAAPTRVSPASATEQKQHHKNNQYGFHCCTSLVKGSWTGLCNGHLISSLPHMIERGKTGV